MVSRRYPRRKPLINLGPLSRRVHYNPPPADACKSTTIPLRLPQRGNELLIWAATYRNRIVDFSVTQRTKLGARWHDVAKIHLEQGAVVADQYFRAEVLSTQQELVDEIPAERGWEVVDNAYHAAVRMMQDRWNESRRRWDDDSE